MQVCSKSRPLHSTKSSQRCQISHIGSKSFVTHSLKKKSVFILDISIREPVKKSFPRRTKNDVFVLNDVENGPKRPYNRPKGVQNV